MKDDMGEFPSGQRGQTVNLLRHASVVRIHLLPPSERIRLNLCLGGFLFGFFSTVMAARTISSLSIVGGLTNKIE